MQKLSEKFMRGIFFTAALVSVISVLLICLFLGINSIPVIKEVGVGDFLTGTVWRPLKGLYGILPMIVGSIYVTAGAILTGVPIGILCAVFLAHFCPKKIYRFLKPATDLLAGIPSIVYGFLGLTVIVPLVQRLFGGSGKGVLAASLILGLMILPSVISISEAALRAIPKSYYEGAVALGATHERGVYSVNLPAAKSGIAAGVVLGVGRAIGEAMAISMVAGNQPVIPNSLFSGVRTLTSNIVLEMGYAAGLHRDALIATAVVLFVFILIINIMFSLINERAK